MMNKLEYAIRSDDTNTLFLLRSRRFLTLASEFTNLFLKEKDFAIESV